MNSLVGEIIGGIHITVCKTYNGDRFFHIQADNEDVSNILDIIVDILTCY